MSYMHTINRQSATFCFSVQWQLCERRQTTSQMISFNWFFFCLRLILFYFFWVVIKPHHLSFWLFFTLFKTLNTAIYISFPSFYSFSRFSLITIKSKLGKLAFLNLLQWIFFLVLSLSFLCFNIGLLLFQRHKHSMFPFVKRSFFALYCRLHLKKMRRILYIFFSSSVCFPF